MVEPLLQSFAGTFFPWAASIKQSMLPATLLLIFSIALLLRLPWMSMQGLRFMSRRHDFVTECLKQTRGRPFSFKVLGHSVTAFYGEKSRRRVLAEQGMDPNAAQRVLGIIPAFTEPDKEKQAEGEALFEKRLLSLIHRDRLAEGRVRSLSSRIFVDGLSYLAIPSLLEDSWVLCEEWGKKGVFDPFVAMYDVVFQMTARVATCRDLYENRQAVAQLQKNFLSLETNATSFSILFPWFPGPAQIGRLVALITIIRKFRKATSTRRQASDMSSDGIDLLVSQGDDDGSIAGTLMGFMMAGTVNTGVMAAWALLYLGSHPHWKERVVNEVKDLLNKHSDNINTDPLPKRLSSVPLKAWEENLPFMDLVIRETVRLIMCGSAIRRNIGRDIEIEGVTIRTGQFATYSLADAHLNPSIYANPNDFDPERYLPGREEDKKEAFAYIGWGAGRHPCIGMKLAILEMKLVLATVLLGFEWELVDRLGGHLKTIPAPARNNLHTIRPLENSCYMTLKSAKASS